MTDATDQFEQGVSVQNKGRLEDAVEAFEKALELDPKNGDAWFRKAFCLHELGRYKEAMDSVGKALEIDPRDTEAMKLKFALAPKVQG